MNFQGPPSFYPMQGPPHLMNAPDMSIKQINATLYIGDIDDQLNEGMLYQYFIKFGPIYSVRIMRDVYNQKKSRGFGYVTYYNPKDGTNFYFSLYCLLFLSSSVSLWPCKSTEATSTLQPTHSPIIPPRFFLKGEVGCLCLFF